MKRNTLEDLFKFISGTSKDKCWKWLGTKHFKGYGIFTLSGKKLKAHRASYMLHHGEIPEGMHILHTCDNPECTNPDHLYAGTNDDNVRDKMVRERHVTFRITHCPKGHEYPEPGGKRRCVECGRIRAREYQRRRRANSRRNRV